MKRFYFVWSFVLAALTGAIGFVAKPPAYVNVPVPFPVEVRVEVPVHHWHGIETEVLADEEWVESSVQYWTTEIARRFPDAYVFVCHGGEDMDGVWNIYPAGGIPMPVQDLVDMLRAKNPDRKIVLIVCNPGDDKIHGKNVFYAHASVWGFPDRATDASVRSQIEPESVGNIFEFIEGE